MQATYKIASALGFWGRSPTCGEVCANAPVAEAASVSSVSGVRCIRLRDITANDNVLSCDVIHPFPETVDGAHIQSLDERELR